MQTLPYVVVTNPHMSHVYELYYKAFEALRRVPEIKTVEDNDRYCKVIGQVLQEHLTVIPRLAMGVLECRDLMKPEDIDKFMNTLLRAVGPHYTYTSSSPELLLIKYTPSREFPAVSSQNSTLLLQKPSTLHGTSPTPNYHQMPTSLARFFSAVALAKSSNGVANFARTWLERHMALTLLSRKSS